MTTPRVYRLMARPVDQTHLIALPGYSGLSLEQIQNLVLVRVRSEEWFADAEQAQAFARSLRNRLGHGGFLIVPDCVEVFAVEMQAWEHDPGAVQGKNPLVN